MSKRPKWKVKAYKKKSLRERLRLEGGACVSVFGKIPKGLDRMFAELMREGSCRYGEPLGVPCVSFSVNGICERDGRTCDIETEKGERYRREYE